MRIHEANRDQRQSPIRCLFANISRQNPQATRRIWAKNCEWHIRRRNRLFARAVCRYFLLRTNCCLWTVQRQTVPSLNHKVRETQGLLPPPPFSPGLWCVAALLGYDHWLAKVHSPENGKSVVHPHANSTKSCRRTRTIYQFAEEAATPCSHTVQSYVSKDLFRHFSINSHYFLKTPILAT